MSTAHFREELGSEPSLVLHSSYDPLLPLISSHSTRPLSAFLSPSFPSFLSLSLPPSLVLRPPSAGLPSQVLGERGEPLGVLDVLTLMEGALLRQQEGNALQMGGLFGSAVAGGGGVAAASAASDANHQWRGLLGASESLAGVPSANGSTSRNASRPPSQPPSRPGSVTAAPALPPAHDSSRASAVQSASGAASFLFKVNVVNGASAGSVFRIHASPDSLSGLAGAVRVKLGLEPADAANDQASDVSGPAGVTSGLVLRYDDEVRETGAQREAHHALGKTRRQQPIPSLRPIVHRLSFPPNDVSPPANPVPDACSPMCGRRITIASSSLRTRSSPRQSPSRRVRVRIVSPYT